MSVKAEGLISTCTSTEDFKMPLGTWLHPHLNGKMVIFIENLWFSKYCMLLVELHWIQEGKRRYTVHLMLGCDKWFQIYWFCYQTQDFVLYSDLVSVNQDFFESVCMKRHSNIMQKPPQKTQLRYSPLFVHFLLHHVSPPGRHRCQACSLLLGLWRDRGVRGETETGAHTSQ